MIYVSYNLKQYQKYAYDIIKSKDNVVELGCHIGNTTKQISRLAEDGTVYAYDNSPEAVKPMHKLQKHQQNIIFQKKDVRNPETLNNQLKYKDKINTLCIDLGGGYHPDTVFKVFFIWSSILKPENTILRNNGLLDFIQNTTYTEKTGSQKGYLETSAKHVTTKSLNELKKYSNKL
ncbi:MAG: class I SAM-dependent methyltransferase [Methanobacteriaceae archaeon]|nr:class I SAM-dependent methyltransferase [Methanobacteriaceae archaeon]